jgi:hypothetical protein
LSCASGHFQLTNGGTNRTSTSPPLFSSSYDWDCVLDSFSIDGPHECALPSGAPPSLPFVPGFFSHSSQPILTWCDRATDNEADPLLATQAGDSRESRRPHSSAAGKQFRRTAERHAAASPLALTRAIVATGIPVTATRIKTGYDRLWAMAWCLRNSRRSVQRSQRILSRAASRWPFHPPLHRLLPRHASPSGAGVAALTGQLEEWMIRLRVG